METLTVEYVDFQNAIKAKHDGKGLQANICPIAQAWKRNNLHTFPIVGITYIIVDSLLRTSRRLDMDDVGTFLAWNFDHKNYEEVAQSLPITIKLTERAEGV